MAELLPLTRGNYLDDTSLFGNRWWCKIDRYGLTEFVLNLHEKGESLQGIASACNAELLKRPDGQKFFIVTRQNIHVFVTQFTKLRAGARKPRFKDRYYKNMNQHPKTVIESAKDMIERNDVELDVVQEFRDSEGALRPDKLLQYTAIMDRQTAALKTAGELYKSLSTHISSVMLRNAVLYFRDLIEGDPYLAVGEKKRIYRYLAQSLLAEKIITQIEADAGEQGKT